MDFQEIDPVRRFERRAQDYVSFRPAYPAAALDAILAGLGDPAALTIVDVGAGTGIATRLLAGRGAEVIGIEPNADMRAAATDAVLDVREGTASAIPLATASADLLTAFQAFHWFSTPDALAEFRRVLKPHGRLALVWNLFEQGDEFTREFCSVLARNTDSSLIAGLGIDEIAIRAIVRSHGFADLRKSIASYIQPLDFDGILGRLRSSGGSPREGPAYERMAREARTVYDRFAHAGAVQLVHRTEIFIAEAT